MGRAFDGLVATSYARAIDNRDLRIIELEATVRVALNHMPIEYAGVRQVLKEVLEESNA